ncbi:MAG: preprotein translocase subunit SecG [Chloroflexi bacterium RBG_16_57_8]|nr:MAG: preprotein translocase subunit SecG [Chloroflexi bacterium RBG_16_57_8]
MQLFLNITQIVLSVALIMVIMLQVRGGGLGGIFGQQDTVYRTRRGLERTLFQLTILLVVVFIVVAIVSLRVV